MTRRALFQIAAVAQQPQRFGPNNTPQCPVCHAQLAKDVPIYLPVVRNADGTTAALTNLRDCFCQQCGCRFVTSA